MRAYERFLRYVRIHTASDDRTGTHPSSARQFDLAKILAGELTALGCSNVRTDEHCYVMAEIPASAGCERCPAVGFIAHMDTVPDFPGENVRPQIIENYDYKGLPCPNLGTGGYGAHGPFEHITVESMDKQVGILTEIVKIYAEKKD